VNTYKVFADFEAKGVYAQSEFISKRRSPAKPQNSTHTPSAAKNHHPISAPALKNATSKP
jgi:hypothetical protein